MIQVYMDYANPVMNIHSDPNCFAVQRDRAANYRISKITIDTLSEELARFRDRYYRFNAQRDTTSIWLDIDLGDVEFERAVAEYVLKLVAKHHLPLRRIKIGTHC